MIHSRAHFVVIGVCLGILSCGSSESKKRGESAPGLTLGSELVVGIAIRPDEDALAHLRTTSFRARLDGCASGLRADIGEQTASANVYRGDRNCLIKLEQFVVADMTWTPDPSDPFETYAAGDVATFRHDRDGVADTIRVRVVTQLQSPIEESTQVEYAFDDLNLASGGTIGDMVGTHEIAVDGHLAPALTLLRSAFSGIADDGAGIFQFTLGCLDPVTGRGAGLKCRDELLADFRYVLVEDTFAGRPTYEQAQALFAGAAPSVDPLADGLPAGSPDAANGGFRTKSGAESLHGPPSMHLKPRMLLVIEAARTSYLAIAMTIQVVAP